MSASIRDKMTFDLDTKKVLLGLSTDRLNRSEAQVMTTVTNEKSQVMTVRNLFGSISHIIIIRSLCS